MVPYSGGQDGPHALPTPFLFYIFAPETHVIFELRTKVGK